MQNITVHRGIRLSKSDRVFLYATGAVITMFLLTVLYPILYILSCSFSSGEAVAAGKVFVIPVDLSVEGYVAVFRHKEILGAYANTLLYTSVGTLIKVTFCLLAAYPLSRRDMPGRGLLMGLFVFTMYFSGGMIPSYILMRDLHILDTIWVVVLPGALSVYYIILLRTFMQTGIPSDLLEAATIDGCSDFRYFTSIVLPLSKASIAVIALYSVVGFWNSYFSEMIYLNTRNKLPLQLILREVLVLSQIDATLIMDSEEMVAKQKLADVLKYALIVVSTLPVLCAYPFAQKFFVKGVMIGSLKG